MPVKRWAQKTNRQTISLWQEMVVDQNESKSQPHRQQILHPYLGKYKIQAIELFFIVNKILFSERI